MKELKDKIKNNEIDSAINIIERIIEIENGNDISYLIDQLESTDNHLLRNAIAICLAKLRVEEAVDPLFKVLSNPKTQGFRGTLLASLESFDYSSHIDILVRFICEGNFEVSRKAFLLVEEVEQDIPNETKLKYISTIKSEIEKLVEKTNFLLEAIDIFTEDYDS